MKSEEIDVFAGDRGEDCNAVRDNMVPAIIFVNVCGREVKHVNDSCISHSAWIDCQIVSLE